MKFHHIKDISTISEMQSDILLIPIMQDANLHRCETQISFIYCYDIENNKEYIFNNKHHDYPHTVGFDGAFSKLKGRIFVYNKSTIYKYLPKSIDIDVMHWCEYNIAIEIQYTPEILQYHRWYYDIKNCNNIIPLMNWLEYCRNIKVQAMELIKMNITEGVDFYTNLVLNSLYSIEDSGLTVNSTQCSKYIKKSPTKLYCQYNMFTTTGRPSNHYDGINFAALDKKTGIRSIFTPTDLNGWLVELDFDSMHVRLAADLIKHVLPGGNLHEYFGRIYFKTPALTEENYIKSKNLTWRLLYGNIDSKYLSIPFFKRIYEFRSELWEQFNGDGYITMPISGRRLYQKNHLDLTPNKLFNYLLQGHETEYNVLMLEKLFKYLYKKKTKLILYTYDSFLFDFDPQDGAETINEIRELLQSSGIDVKLSYGKNYHRMVK